MNLSVSLGNRLREERGQLKLTQAEFGKIGGITKKTQMLYEKCKRFPDAAYLAAIAAKGVDVLYVLTGQKLDELAEIDTKESVLLTKRELALIDNYRRTDPEGQRVIEVMATLGTKDTTGQVLAEN